MRSESGKLEGDFDLTGSFQLNGMCTGTLHVKAGGRLLLNGMSREVVVSTGGEATINGSVTESVVNNGGKVSIYGTVRRVVSNSGDTYIDPNAEVLG